MWITTFQLLPASFHQSMYLCPDDALQLHCVNISYFLPICRRNAVCLFYPIKTSTRCKTDIFRETYPGFLETPALVAFLLSSLDLLVFPELMTFFFPYLYLESSDKFTLYGKSHCVATRVFQELMRESGNKVSACDVTCGEFLQSCVHGSAIFKRGLGEHASSKV